MIGKYWMGFILFVAASATMAVANAQRAPASARPEPTDIQVIGKLTDRSAVIQSQALDHQGIGLSGAQQSEINRLVDTYLQEQRKVDEQYPLAQGSRPSAEHIRARQAVIVTMTTAVTKLLDPVQLKAWRDAMAVQRKPRDPAQFFPSGR